MAYKLGICTRFRDAMQWHGHQINQIDRYFEQIFAQNLIDQNQLGIFCLEGNSADNTYDKLYSYYKSNTNIHLYTDGDLVNTETNIGAVGSTTDAARLQRLGKLGAALLDEARSQCETVIWLEADIIITNPVLFHKLVLGANELQSVVAPWIWICFNGRYIFYDIWAFRNLDTDQQWHFRTPKPATRYLQMNSIGSCCAIPKCVLETSANFGPNEFLDFCKSVRESGYRVFVDSELEIEHPGNYYINKRWI